MDAEHTGICPACGGPTQPMGVLGKRLHSRCRGCGMDSSREIDTDLRSWLNQQNEDSDER